MDFELSPPSSAAMLESLRAYGYSLNSAIADLIDNSITAKAKNIWITLHWSGEASWISILDDGTGMSERQLAKAMIAGSQNPLNPRDLHDLGRFGLGLKTASLSLARSLTVASKTDSTLVTVRRWDLDYIAAEQTNEWRLLKTARVESEQKLSQLVAQPSGTIVLLENLDKLCAGTAVTSPAHRSEFYHQVDSLSSHLGMIFHRFLSNPARLKIYINGTSDAHRVIPWDPFCTKHKATDPKPSVKIPFGSTLTEVQGYVLPHKDMMTQDEYEDASGPNGWNAHQGFYVYRGDRLLVCGSWLGLRDGATKWREEEHYKLARIKVDITNEMDGDWKIDVKKSLATPPPNVAAALVNYSAKVRSEAREVFAHRGKYGKRQTKEKIQNIWLAKQHRGMNTYHIDRAHPLIKSLFSLLDSNQKQLETIFKLIEETVPVEQIWLDSAESPEKRSTPFSSASESEIIEAASNCLKLLQSGSDKPSDSIINQICSLECFVEHSDLIYAHFGAK
jgi:hypothetical protein